VNYRDRPILDLLNIGRYAKSNITMIRDARQYRPLSLRRFVNCVINITITYKKVQKN